MTRTTGGDLSSIWRLWVPCVAVVLSLAGCGGENLVPVEGSVTLDGNPMAGVHVLYFPTEADANDATQYRGKTDDQGHYSLERASDDGVGLKPGTYRVSLTTAVIEGFSDELTPTPPERVPPKYRDGTLTFEVPEGGTTEADFPMTSR